VNIVNIVNVSERRNGPGQYFVLILEAIKSRGNCLEMIAADMLFMALARLIAVLLVAQRLQLLELVRNSLEPIHIEAAAAKA
jgi:hypothetical protein